MRLIEMCKAADEVEVDGHTYAWGSDATELSEVLTHDGAGIRFNGAYRFTLVDQELVQNPVDPFSFIANSDEGAYELRFVRKLVEYLNTPQPKEN